MQHSTSSAGYAVFSARPDRRLPVRELAGPLVPLVEMPRADVAQRLRWAGGFVLRDVPEEVARAAAIICAEHQLPTRCEPEAELHPLPALRVAQLVDPRKEALWLHVGHDLNVHGMEWSAVRAVHVYALRVRPSAPTGQQRAPLAASATRSLSPAAAGLQHALAESRAAREHLTLRIDLVTSDHLVRLDRERLNFKFLGEDRREHSLDNFLLLAGRLVEQATEALIVPETRAFLDNPAAELAHIRFIRRDELAHYTHRLLQLIDPPLHQPESHVAA